MQLNIDNSEVVAFTNKLEKLNRSALPVAVRQTLNSTAFDAKQRTLLEVSSKEFTNRQKNFFKANSRAFTAKGFDIRTMESAVGMVDGKLKGESNYAVKDLVQQEKGGTIKGRSMIPVNQARTSNSESKSVRKKYRVNSIRNVINAQNMKGNSNKQKFLAAANKAGVGGFVLSADYRNGGVRFIYEITSLRKLKFKPVYSYNQGRSVKVEATHFMENTAKKASLKMDDHFKKHAKQQFQKAFK